MATKPPTRCVMFIFDLWYLFTPSIDQHDVSMLVPAITPIPGCHPKAVAHSFANGTPYHTNFRGSTTHTIVVLSGLPNPIWWLLFDFLAWISMDWFKGTSSGNHWFLPTNIGLFRFQSSNLHQSAAKHDWGANSPWPCPCKTSAACGPEIKLGSWT